jgi:catechol 2,3-dioxygenase-like lactoylglutathione lyase family enzyme
MNQRLSFITIGVDNLEVMTRFYKKKFGWTPLKEMDGISFFLLNGFVLGLFPANELAADIGIQPGGSGFKRFTLSINFNSEKEVDSVVEDLKSKGVEIVKAPEKVFWGGYSGYIKDPENNYWELAYNPYLEQDSNNNIIGHQ